MGSMTKQVWMAAIAVSALAFVGYSSRASALPVVSQESRFSQIDEIKAAAEQGNAEAQNRLGFNYDWGAGVPQDSERAVYWFTKAAEQGFSEAQYNLGVMYYLGRGVPQEPARAVYWWIKAAKQGSAAAQFSLNLMR